MLLEASRPEARLVYKYVIFLFFTYIFFMELGLMEQYCNRGIKKQVELFFGEGSRVELLKSFYLTQSKSQQITAKVYLTDPEVTLQYWPQNINWIVEEAFQFVNGRNTKMNLVVQATYDVI
mgnify:FL=1